jgi:hydroxymethylpyrimidine pyrophosphatase-like HAD family hydrolase
MQQLILAIDFDGTTVKTEKDYVPRSLMPNAKEVINWAHDKGCYIIIWTCRSGKMLTQATDFLKKNKIKFDAVNENKPDVDFQTSNKIFSDFYIDDRSFEINWLNIKEQIKKKILEKQADEIEDLTKEKK